LKQHLNNSLLSQKKLILHKPKAYHIDASFWIQIALTQNKFGKKQQKGNPLKKQETGKKKNPALFGKTGEKEEGWKPEQDETKLGNDF